MNKHSPGPWKFVYNGWDDEACDSVNIEVSSNYSGEGYSHNPYIRDANGDTVVGCDEYNVFYSDNQAANVALLLAAPDLLAVLESVLSSMIHSDTSLMKTHPWVPGVDAKNLKPLITNVIKKAKGEQQ